MPSGTLGPPDLSFQLLVFIRALLVNMTYFMCYLVRKSANADGGQGADGQRARALQIRYKRTHVNSHDGQFRKKFALLLEGARPVAVVKASCCHAHMAGEMPVSAESLASLSRCS
eukprot:453025-Pleurochrysis_carterae.AAC.2